VILLPSRFVTIGEVLFGEPVAAERVDLRQYLQRPEPLAGAASCAPFRTLHVDLRQSEEQLLAGIKKGTRYEIRRAEQEGVRAIVAASDRLHEFEAFFTKFAASKDLTAPSGAQLAAYARAGVLALSYAETTAGQVLVWHAHLCANGRARLWLSASAASDTDKAARAATGRANRLLHWHDMQMARASGYATYDVGGWDGESTDPRLQGISRFKEELGGRVVTEFNCTEVMTIRGRAYKAAEQIVTRVRRAQHVTSVSPRSLLRCPEDKSQLVDEGSALKCRSCGRRYPIEDGIVRFITPDAELDDPIKDDEMHARDAAADSYDARFSRVRNAIEIPPSLRALAPGANDRIVELGCGSGRMTLRYADRVSCVIGIDFSLASLQVLQRKLTPEQRERVLLVQADVCKPPIEDHTATKVASFQVFEHLPEQTVRAAATRAAATLLAPGGTFVLSVYNWSSNKQRLSARGIGDNTAKQGFHAGTRRIFYFNFEPADIHALFDQAGLTIEALRGLDAQIPGIDRVGWFAVPINRLLERVPLGRRFGHLLLAVGRVSDVARRTSS